MSTKQNVLRALEGLPDDALREVEDFVAFIKENKRMRQSPFRQGRVLAKEQFAAIKRWAGKNLGVGFSGREHDAILYGGSR